MANSKFEYVRDFEKEEYLLPNTWIVVRIDGRGFHKLSKHYDFEKPNDLRALNLMNAAAKHVLSVLHDVVIAYGHSDEYSFVFKKSTVLFERRQAKLVSTVVSTFTAAYVHLWSTCFTADVPERRHHGQLEATFLPSFDGRAICYPSDQNLRDYMSWRQADCHINNLYNTTFWTLILKGGKTNAEAEDELKGTFSADKNEILWSRFGINYNNEPELCKKGSVVFRDIRDPVTNGTHPSKTQQEKQKKATRRAEIVVEHLDIIKDDFWTTRPWLLVP